MVSRTLVSHFGVELHETKQTIDLPRTILHYTIAIQAHTLRTNPLLLI